MVSAYHPKPLVINQESTRYGVAASELSYPLCSIIDAVSVSSKEKRKKACFNSGHRIEDHFVDITEMIAGRMGNLSPMDSFAPP